jgi:methylenetetrahydrofolate dehydrogenase (NADP+)/methenyltetrahydrofolate cyclohydrolase
MKLIDGKKIADEIQQEIKAVIDAISGRRPCLVVVQLGDHPASKIYVSRKIQACSSVGMISIKRHLPVTTSEQELLEEIDFLNSDPTVDGILVQLPLPHHIDSNKITLRISPDKDVDGFHPINVGKMFLGSTDAFLPCTPLGIKTLLERYEIEVAGKHVVVFGRSNIVGKPVAAMLMQGMPGGNATVTIAHRYSRNIPDIARLADIMIVAVGQSNFITADMVKPGAVIIDVGINKIDCPSRPSGYRIVGDVDFESVKSLCSYITPVPGGVGPMTIAMLLKNTLKSYQKRENRRSE